MVLSDQATQLIIGQLQKTFLLKLCVLQTSVANPGRKALTLGSRLLASLLALTNHLVTGVGVVRTVASRERLLMDL